MKRYEAQATVCDFQLEILMQATPNGGASEEIVPDKRLEMVLAESLD